jgi:hypothetical protein
VHDREQSHSFGTLENPYTRVRTVIYDLAREVNLAWIDDAVWPHVGSVIELSLPNQDATVLGVRLFLANDETALIRVDVHVPEDEDTIPRHPVDQLLG